MFGVGDPATGTERVVVLAETREKDAAKRAELTASINALAAEFIGGPADEVVLAPPHSVLKTSSGKIRRAASREVYERGLIGARRPALWRELAALALRAVRGRVAQSVAQRGSGRLLVLGLGRDGTARDGRVPLRARAAPGSSAPACGASRRGRPCGSPGCR